MFDRIKSMFGRRNVPSKSKDEQRINMVRSSFDNAKTTDENSNHWANADDKTAVHALTADVRRKLRMRARYEAENNCFDDQTEVLTRKGFKFFRDVTMEDELASVNLRTNAIEYEFPLRVIHRQYSGEMIRIGGKERQKLDMFVTPEHRMVVYEGWDSDIPVFKLAKDINYRDRIKASADWIGKSQKYTNIPVIGKYPSVDVLTVDLSEFLGWVVSEGSAISGKQSKGGKYYRVNISQNRYSNPDKFDRIKCLLKRLPWKFHYRDDGFVLSGIQVYTVAYQCGKGSHNKKIPQWIKDSNKDVLLSFINAAVSGDGCRSDGRETYATVSKQLSDDIQEVWLKLGYGVSQRFVEAKVCVFNGVESKQTSGHYVISRKLARPLSLASYHNTSIVSKEYYNGMVHCATVFNSTLIVRRNGKTVVCGNCYCGGLVSTLAIDLIGYTLPKLRIIDDNPAIKTLIEDEWRKWTENDKVNLSAKCRLLEETKWIEGESFLVSQSDDEVFKETGLNLNYNVVGAARVTDPYDFHYGAYKTEVYDDVTSELSGYRYEYNDDGVIIDMMTGRPIKFKIVAPIDDLYSFGAMIKEPTEVDAKYCIQWFERKRPGQYRGYSPLTPTLNLYAQLRRIDLATLTSVETAAMLAGIMKTNAPVDAPATVPSYSKMPLERGTLLSLPDGWEAVQFKPEQPLQVYEMFVNIILRQIGRAINVPFGIVAGDSSKYNYSSAQLDIRGYEESRKYDQNQFSIVVMNRVFKDFLYELSFINPAIRDRMMTTGIYHNWTYAKRPSSDPQKDASAEQTRLTTYATNLSEVYSARGLDWEEELEQRKKELDKMASLGLNNATSAPVDEAVTV